MPFNPEEHHRRSIRLKDYEYSQPGSYFITICTHNHINLFGKIVSLRAGLEPARTSWSSNNNPELALQEFSKMNLNIFGEEVLSTWKDLVNHIIGIKLGEFVIMPNHFHGIIHIIDPENEWHDFIPSQFIYHDVGIDTVRAGSEPAPNNQVKQTPLSEVIRQFKTFSTRKINRVRKSPGHPVWKRDYYEHIIRDQKSYDQIVEYIQNNPIMWNLDKFYKE